MQYVNCTVTILNDAQLDFVVSDNGNTNTLHGRVSIDPFAKLTVERLNYWITYALKEQETNIRKVLYDIDDLQVIGLNLYRILFGQSDIAKLFTDTYTKFVQDYNLEVNAGLGKEQELRMRLQLVFTKEAEELSHLPWEFLFVPGAANDIGKGFFFSGEKTELILTRFVPPSQILKRQPRQEKLRILVAVCNAVAGMGGVLQTEVDKLIATLKSIPRSEVVVIPNPTYKVLSEEIGQAFQPHILHYIGHGQSNGLAMFIDKSEAEYDIDTGGEQIRWIAGKFFRQLFNQHKPRLIFLHACRGAVAMSNENLNSTARELVKADIPAVIAMQYSISNDDAGLFARKFYEELGKGSMIDAAVQAGRVELGKNYPPMGHPRFATPVVYLQTNEAIVLPVPEPSAEELKAAGAKESVTASSPLGVNRRTTLPSSDQEFSTPAPALEPGERRG